MAAWHRSSRIPYANGRSGTLPNWLANWNELKVAPPARSPQPSRGFKRGGVGAVAPIAQGDGRGGMAGGMAGGGDGPEVKTLGAGSGPLDVWPAGRPMLGFQELAPHHLAVSAECGQRAKLGLWLAHPSCRRRGQGDGPAWGSDAKAPQVRMA